MKVFLYSLCGCLWIGLLTAYPIWDEQQQKLCDKNYKITYEGPDKALLEGFIMHPTETRVRQKYHALRNCCSNMDKSWLKFVKHLKHTLSANAQAPILNQQIPIMGELQKTLGVNSISVATAIWIYNIPFLTDKKLDKVAKQGNISCLNKRFNQYAKSFIAMGDVWH